MSTIASLPVRLFTLLLYFGALSWPEPIASRTLFVEEFTTRANANKLRQDVIAELRKGNAVHFAGMEKDADLILDGAGEIWVKGYRSLNPRVTRVHSDGMPLYDGYLAVELKNAKGETLWSDLVTPPANSADVSRDLARRIARNVAEALENGSIVAPTATPLPETATVLKGAGATFPQPVYEKWFTNYRRVNLNLKVEYAAVGSKTGIERLLAGQEDFGGSDNPEVIRDLAPERQDRFLLFPSVVGAVVPIVNLPGVPDGISLTPEALAGIYLGKIKKWNDPILRAANKKVHLPDLDIVVVHRAEGSGTSYAFTDFLSKTSAEWNSAVGKSLSPQWPVGKAANGNDGVAQMVKEFGGAIGYVEFIYALKNHLSSVRVRNRNGESVAASLESMAAACAQANNVPDDFKLSIVDPPQPGAYPIATFTWLIVPAATADEGKRQAMKGFLHWILGPGQTQAAALGYLALPKGLAAREQAAIDKLH